MAKLATTFYCKASLIWKEGTFPDLWRIWTERFQGLMRPAASSFDHRHSAICCRQILVFVVPSNGIQRWDVMSSLTFWLLSCWNICSARPLQTEWNIRNIEWKKKKNVSYFSQIKIWWTRRAPLDGQEAKTCARISFISHQKGSKRLNFTNRFSLFWTFELESGDWQNKKRVKWTLKKGSRAAADM